MYYSPALTPDVALGQTNFVLILTSRFLFLVSSSPLPVGFSSYFLRSGCQIKLYTYLLFFPCAIQTPSVLSSEGYKLFSYARVVTPCKLGRKKSAYVGSRFLHNVGKFLPECTASLHSRQ